MANVMRQAMIRSYPKSRRIQFDAYSVLGAWALLVTCGLLFALGLAFRLSIDAVLITTFTVFLVVALLHVVLALSHRCPSCNKHPTVQGLAPIHPSAVPQSGMSGWARVIWDVYRRQQFTCIHCGEQFRVDTVA